MLWAVLCRPPPPQPAVGRQLLGMSQRGALLFGQ